MTEQELYDSIEELAVQDGVPEALRYTAWLTNAYSDSSKYLLEFTDEYLRFCHGEGSIKELQRLGNLINEANIEMVARYDQIEQSLEHDPEQCPEISLYRLSVDIQHQLEATARIFSNSLNYTSSIGY